MTGLYLDSEIVDDVDSMLAQLETCERTLRGIRSHLAVLDSSGRICPDRVRGHDWRGYLPEKASTLERAAHNLAKDIALIAARVEASRKEVASHG